MYNALPRLLYAVIASSLVWSIQTAHAEVLNSPADLQNNPRLKAYLWSRPMNEMLFRLGQAQDQQLGIQTSCQSETQVKPMGLVILSPIELPNTEQTPSAGAWLSRYEFTRCGESKIYNALFSVNPTTGEIEHEAYIPGNTMANPLLVRDAMASALISATARSNMQHCKDVTVFDMQVTDAPRTVQTNGTRTLGGGWREKWIMNVCGKTVDVPITFTPSRSGGTTFNIESEGL